MKPQLLLIAFFGLLFYKGNSQAIATSNYHSLAVKEDGTVVAWGDNLHKQSDVPNRSRGGVAVSTGWAHSLALKDDGTVVAWGLNKHKQCDVPNGLKGVIAVAAGRKHSLALKDDGTVVAWGLNNHKQCEVPQGLKDVIAVAAGWSHSLALKEDGAVVAWGENLYKQCEVPLGLKDVILIEAGAFYSLAVKEDRTVVAWGDNFSYQCEVPKELKEVIAVAAGRNHSLAVKEDGTVVAWGRNYNQQCEVPKGLKGVIAVAAGWSHSLALKEDGTLVAWGRNNYNQCKVPNGLYVKTNADVIVLDSKPPILSISDIQFIDENRNKTIDAFEETSVTFSIDNTGPGPGYRLNAKVSISGNNQGIEFKENHTLETVDTGSSQNYSIPISSSRFTTDGSLIINVEVIEPKGFSPEPFALEIDTRAFRAPKLEVVDFSSSMTTWGPNTPIGLDVLIQNTGEGTAENVEVELKLPNAVNCYSSNLSIEVTYIAPGETLPITYDMIVPRNYSRSSVNANLTITEKFGDYGSAWNHNFPFEGGSNSSNVISIESAEGDETIAIDRASLNSNRAADISFNQVPKDIVVNTVAVLPIDGIDCSKKTVSGQDLASFTEGSLLGLYNVVERRNLERVLDEQKLALSGVLYEKSAVEAGCNVGAQGIIFTEYGCLTGQEVIQLKLVDCQTSELYWSATGINATAKQVLDKVREELGKE